MWKKRFVGLAVALVLIAIGGAAFVGYQVSAFDRSVEKVYACRRRTFGDQRSAWIARGQQLVAVASCGDDLGGKTGDDMGPLGSTPGSNITAGKGGTSRSIRSCRFRCCAR